MYNSYNLINLLYYFDYNLFFNLIIFIFDKTKPEVEQCRATGQELMSLCGEPDKPEVKKHMEDLDSAWDNITALYARREENLIDAMEKAMEFHDTLQVFISLFKIGNKLI